MSHYQYKRYLDSLQALASGGAHLLPLYGKYSIDYDEQPQLYEQAKRPKVSWKKTALTNQIKQALDDYRNKNNFVGMIPATAGLVCLDLDEGKNDELNQLLDTIGIDYETIETRRGWHYIMRADQSWPKGNWNWEWGSCKGEIRFDNGYILLWNPNKIAKFYNMRESMRPAGHSLAQEIRVNRQQAQREAREKRPIDQSELDFGPYPPGARDEQLFIDLSKLVNARKDDDKRIAEIKRAWLDAPDPKNQGRDARALIFEEKLTRLRDQRKAEGEYHFDRKDEEALRLALIKLNVAWRYDERGNKFDWKDNGAAPPHTDDRLTYDLIKRIAATFTWQSGNNKRELRYSINSFEQYMTALANDPERCHDPFIRWIETLPAWDGKARIDNFLSNHFDAPDEALTRWASRYPMIAAIQRAYEPGAKIDETPVIIGKQGLGKTAYVRNLLPPEHQQEWFADQIDINTTEKERLEKTLGTVIVEISEMAGVGRHWQKLKAYLSAQTDKARMAYGRKATPVPRRFIFVGTADRREVLPNDPAGNRRFVAIEIQSGCHIENILTEQRGQLWAEALSQYNAGIRANLPRELMAEQQARNEDYRQADDEYENRVAELDEGVFYTINQLIERWDVKSPSGRERNRITKALRNAGFENKQGRVPGHKNPKRGWIKNSKLL